MADGSASQHSTQASPAGPSTPRKKTLPKKLLEDGELGVNGSPRSTSTKGSGRKTQQALAPALAAEGMDHDTVSPISTRPGVAGSAIDDDETIDGDDLDETAGHDANGRSPSQQRQGSKRGGPSSAPVPGTPAFPMAKVKRLGRTDGDIEQLGQDGTFLLGIAASVFIARITNDAIGALRLQGDKRRVVSYADLVRATKQSDNYEFLLDVLPEQVPLDVALKRSQLVQPEEDAADAEAEAEARAIEERALETDQEEESQELPTLSQQVS